MKAAFLSVVTSMYNEEENVERFVEEVEDALKNQAYDSEIIIVDNGSTDSTGSRCDSLAAAHKNLVIIHASKPTKGKGNGIRLALQAAKGQHVSIMDGDLQQYPADIPYLLEIMRKRRLDYIVGWRKPRHDPLHRIILSRIYNFMVKLLFNIPSWDIAGHPRVFRRECLKDIKIRSNKWIIEVELPYYAKKGGFKGGWAVVRHRKREKGISKLAIGDILYIFIGILKLRFGGFHE
ncbi:MAG: glycosyltransferase family 2 protein [Candidatus Aenigmarchaeota archaeon]|nr:glycosyltransferase family 2 protein [Candidatus Aenigmarchaeota archaeon]